jgi:hypothetical protein
MSAVIIEAASLTVPLVGSGIPAHEIANHDFVRSSVVDSLDALLHEVALTRLAPSPSFPIGPN